MKLCILLDPNKKQVNNVIEACKLVGNKREIEWWVGCSKSDANSVKEVSRKMREKGLKPIHLFPGRLLHLRALKHVDNLLVPRLVICKNKKLKLVNTLGYWMTRWIKNKTVFGYLVTGSDSSVGKRVGAKELGDQEIIGLSKKFLDNHEVDGFYLEAGSGHKKHVTPKVVKAIKKILKNKTLLVGGGIKNPKMAKELFKAGADKVVVGTVFELNDIKKIVKSIQSFL